MASRLGWLPVNAFTANASQIGSVVEFVMLSFALSDRIKMLQQTLLQAQENISDNLRNSERLLNDKVQQRTAALEAANAEILSAYNAAEVLRESAESAKAQAERQHQQAEAARQQTAQALQELQTTQTQLIAAEKMASIGLLVSNVAHEINSPVGAIKSSNLTIADSMQATLLNMPKLLDSIGRENRTLFLQLVTQTSGTEALLSTRDERALTKQLTTFLDNAGVDGAIRKARLIVKLRAHAHATEYLPLLNSPDCDFILSVAAGVGDVLSGTSNINAAVSRVSRIVNSLKELSGGERATAMFENQVYQSIEHAIAANQHLLHDVDVVRNYQDMGPLRCDPEALQQVWAHLILNGLHAMQHRGTLMIGLRTVNNHAEIRIADFGCGIAADIKDRIFEPFFTTRASGEGGGMGLAIAKKIVEQHQGRIELQTEPGFGSTFTVLLPYDAVAK
jgi:signal transduction histidine kinase